MRFQGMGRRLMKGGGEYDVFSVWRKWLCYTQRAGVTSKIKRKARKRERRESKSDIRREDG